MITDSTISEFEQRRYHAYPHANGFADDGKSIVLGQLEDSGVSLWKVELGTGHETLIRRFATPTNQKFFPELWFDVALNANVLVTVAEGKVWLIDLDKPGHDRELYRKADGLTLQTLPSINANGSKVLLSYQRGNAYGIIRINVANLEVTQLVEHDWWVNHAHFMPHDSAWVSYCHEGRADTVPDRMWGWHAEHAPHGRPLFNQASSQAGVPLQVGHEVACFHEPSLLVVAYGASAIGPRGLYEIFLDDRKPRLISEANRDLHCHPSRCGRWAVVDTSGPHDLGGKGWENAGDVSDIILIDKRTARRRVLTRTTHLNHPWHSHPVFSPDGRSIVYSEGRDHAGKPAGRVHLLKTDMGFDLENP